MDLTPATVTAARREYPDRQALAGVERDHLDMLPRAFAEGEFGWRDAEWVVQWYYRRDLGAFPDETRRAREGAYGENDYEAIEAAIEGAVEADGATAKLEHLTTLSGVGVAVGSAFLQFIEPDDYVVVGEREWTVLRAAGELDGDYPAPPSVQEYERYLDACRTVADRCDSDPWAVYRALWVLGRES